MKIIQLQVVPVPNVSETQCHAFLYALTDEGGIYFRRNNDAEWTKEPDFKLSDNAYAKCQWTINNNRAIPGCQVDAVKYWNGLDTFRLWEFYQSFSPEYCPWCGKRLEVTE